MEREDKNKCRKDGRYRLGGNIMKTDGDVIDTRGHRSKVKEAENFENSRADDDRFDQSNRNSGAKHYNGNIINDFDTMSRLMSKQHRDNKLCGEK
eukprot:4118440-Heterocapsa_arctica.AAC.1